MLFLMFVVLMFSDQICVIWENTSTIDSLKKKAGIECVDDKGSKAESRSGFKNVKEVFGGDQSSYLDWLWPTQLKRTLIVEKEFD